MISGQIINFASGGSSAEDISIQIREAIDAQPDIIGFDTEEHKIGDLVKYNGVVYETIQAHVIGQEFSDIKFKKISVEKAISSFSTSEDYLEGVHVKYMGETYISKGDIPRGMFSVSSWDKVTNQFIVDGLVGDGAYYLKTVGNAKAWEQVPEYENKYQHQSAGHQLVRNFDLAEGPNIFPFNSNSWTYTRERTVEVGANGAIVSNDRSTFFMEEGYSIVPHRTYRFSLTVRCEGQAYLDYDKINLRPFIDCYDYEGNRINTARASNKDTRSTFVMPSVGDQEIELLNDISILPVSKASRTRILLFPYKGAGNVDYSGINYTRDTLGSTRINHSATLADGRNADADTIKFISLSRPLSQGDINALSQYPNREVGLPSLGNQAQGSYLYADIDVNGETSLEPTPIKNGRHVTTDPNIHTKWHTLTWRNKGVGLNGGDIFPGTNKVRLGLLKNFISSPSQRQTHTDHKIYVTQATIEIDKGQ